MVTLYSTPTCARCKVAEKQLSDAGMLAEKVDLTDQPAKIEELKDRLGVVQLDLPVLERGGELFGMTDLRNIVRSIN